MKEKKKKMKLLKLDDLFTSQEQRDFEKAGKISLACIMSDRTCMILPFK